MKQQEQWKSLVAATKEAQSQIGEVGQAMLEKMEAMAAKLSPVYQGIDDLQLVERQNRIDKEVIELREKVRQIEQIGETPSYEPAAYGFEAFASRLYLLIFAICWPIGIFIAPNRDTIAIRIGEGFLFALVFSLAILWIGSVIFFGFRFDALLNLYRFRRNRQMLDQTRSRRKLFIEEFSKKCTLSLSEWEKLILRWWKAAFPGSVHDDYRTIASAAREVALKGANGTS